MKKLLILTFFFSIFVLAGCAQQSYTLNFLNEFLVGPFVSAIEFLSLFFNDNYGLAIVLLTLMIRFSLLPLMMDQYKQQKHVKEKMDLIRPDLEVLQNKLKLTKIPNEQVEIQQKMVDLYKSHNISPFQVGCLPLIIQMPILMGFYYAIRTSEQIGQSSFLWFSLGESDWILTIIAGIIYYFQFKVNQTNMPQNQQTQMQYLGLLSPLMIIFISANAPAALPLYWTIGGFFLIIQTLVCKKLYS